METTRVREGSNPEEDPDAAPLIGSVVASAHSTEPLNCTIKVHSHLETGFLRRVRVWPQGSAGNPHQSANFLGAVSTLRRSQGIRNTQETLSDCCLCGTSASDYGHQRSATPPLYWLASSMPPISEDSSALSAVRLTLLAGLSVDSSPASAWELLQQVDSSNVFASSPQGTHLSKECVIADDIVHFKKQISALSLHTIATPSSVRLLIGFHSGDVLYLHHSPSSRAATRAGRPASRMGASRTLQFNRLHKIASGRVCALSWVVGTEHGFSYPATQKASTTSPEPVGDTPSSEPPPGLFFASFSQPAGILFLLDTTRADPSEAFSGHAQPLQLQPASHGPGALPTGDLIEGRRGADEVRGDIGLRPEIVRWVNPSATSNPVCSFEVASPSSIVALSLREPAAVSSIAASTGNHTELAVTSRDGVLRVLLLDSVPLSSSALESSLPSQQASWHCRELARAQSSYGALLCVAWGPRSPSGSLLATGGEDDTVSLWRLIGSGNGDTERRQLSRVAKGKGHQSFVSAVRFFSHASGFVHLVSAGQDCACVVWDVLSHDRLQVAGKSVVGPAALCSVQVIPSASLLFVSSLRGYFHFFAWASARPLAAAPDALDPSATAQEVTKNE